MRRCGLLLLALLAGCGSGGTDTVAQGRGLHTGSGMVLESPDRGPRLCAGVEESLPPQCSGVPLVGWDWAAVVGEESANGTTWGTFSVRGRFDGESLTVTEPPGPPQPPRPHPPIETPCDPPAGGWRSGTTSPDEAVAHARTAPDHAGTWVDGPVLTLAFTSDVERHRAEAGERYDGALCVVRHERSLADLLRIQDELTARSDLGVTSSWTSEDRNLVVLGVLAVTPEQQAALDAEYGAGAVQVHPMLVPE